MTPVRALQAASLLLAALSLAGPPANAQSQPTAPARVLVQAGSLIDGRSDTPRREVTIVVEGERIVDVVAGTREPGAIRIGASPRASLALQKLAQALALMDGERFVTPDHVREIALPALAHRVTLDTHAQFAGASADDALAEALAKVPVPV